MEVYESHTFCTAYAGPMERGVSWRPAGHVKLKGELRDSSMAKSVHPTHDASVEATLMSNEEVVFRLNHGQRKLRVTVAVKNGLA